MRVRSDKIRRFLLKKTVYLVNGTIFELSQSIFHYEEAKLLNQINFK